MPRLHNNLHRLIFSTLAYFDIFDFPLTQEEIRQFLHVSKKIPQQHVEKSLITIPHKTVDNNTFYFLPGREAIVQGRYHKTKISETKLREMLPIIQLLGFLPSITFIGLSGSVAMKNGGMESDVDVFVITLPYTLWLTRLSIWILLGVFSKRRQRTSTGQDSICVNLLMDRNHLLFPLKKHDLYTAHEIMQVLPVVNKYGTYELFLEKNAWVMKYLANSYTVNNSLYSVPFWLTCVSFLCIPVERVCMWIQLFYMRNHKTIEQTTAKLIAFHPYNYHDTIMNEYKKRLQTYGL